MLGYINDISLKYRLSVTLNTIVMADYCLRDLSRFYQNFIGNTADILDFFR